MSTEHGLAARLNCVCLVFEDEADFRPKQRERQGRLSNRPDDLPCRSMQGFHPDNTGTKRYAIAFQIACTLANY